MINIENQINYIILEDNNLKEELKLYKQELQQLDNITQFIKKDILIGKNNVLVFS